MVQGASQRTVLIRRTMACSADPAVGRTFRRRPFRKQAEDSCDGEPRPSKISTITRRKEKNQPLTAQNTTTPETSETVKLLGDGQSQIAISETSQVDNTVCSSQVIRSVDRVAWTNLITLLSSRYTNEDHNHDDQFILIDLESFGQLSRISPDLEASASSPPLPGTSAISIPAQANDPSISALIRNRLPRPCYILIALGCLTIIGSLAPAMWRSENRDDIAGGFSLAQYTLGVGVFVIGSIVVIHSKHCICWQYKCGKMLP